MTLRVEREYITVESISATKPDPTWTYVDKAGHRHRWVAEISDYPMLVVVDEPPYWCSSCRDEHVDSHYECMRCGETIQPRVLADPGPHYLPGPVHYWLDDKPITKEQADAFIEEHASEPA